MTEARIDLEAIEDELFEDVDLLNRCTDESITNE